MLIYFVLINGIIKGKKTFFKKKKEGASNSLLLPNCRYEAD